MASFSRGLSGATSGGLTGASIGSAIPGVGTAIGGLGGALIGGIGGLFGKKKKKRPRQLSTFDPQQQELYNQYTQALRGQGPLANIYGYDANAANQNFDANVSRPAYRNFQENIVPSITGQFRSGGLQNSTYLGQALSRAGRDVQENLDALRSNTMFQGQQNSNLQRQSGIENALNRQTFANQRPTERAPSMLDQILGQAAPAAGDWFADFIRNNGKTAGTATPTT